jgi:hypothetical protein
MIDNNLAGYIETSAHIGTNIKFIFAKLAQDIYLYYSDNIIIDNKYIETKKKSCY